jgi:hypothetical protein
MFREELIFKNPPPINIDYWTFFVKNGFNIGSLTPPNAFADEDPNVLGEVTTGAYDFSFNTASKSAKAATDGLPLGDPRWVPFTPVSAKNLTGNSNRVRTYPNPANDIVTFEIESKEPTSARIIISDLLGKQLMILDKQLIQGSNQVRVNIDKVSKPGIYLYQVIGSSGAKLVSSGKLIKR